MRIARVFFDVHMGQNFKGLLSICHDAKIKPEAEDDSYIVFINSNLTKFKLLIGNKYLIYHDNGNRKIPLNAIKFLPTAFEGAEFDFNKSVEKSLKEKGIGINTAG